MQVLGVLNAVSRRALLLAHVTLSELFTLPLEKLRPTLLIAETARNPALIELLSSASGNGKVFIPHHGKLRNLRCASAYYIGETPHLMAAPSAILISVHPADGGGALNWNAIDEVGRRLQPQLLGYRLKNGSRIKHNHLPACDLPSPLREGALNLAASVVDDAELRDATLELFRGRAEEVRAHRSASIPAVVLEAALALCHEGKLKARVGEITRIANTIWRGRGDTWALEPRSVGEVLRSVGLHTERLDAASRGVRLLQPVRRLVHELGKKYYVPSLAKGMAGCAECKQLLGTSMEKAHARCARSGHNVHRPNGGLVS